MTLVLDEPSEIEGPRIGFTVEDVWRMVEAGVLATDERFELLHGELVPMQAETPGHSLLTVWMTRQFHLQASHTHWVASGVSFYLGGYEKAASFTIPDLNVFPLSVSPPDVRGDTCTLLVENAVTSLRKDIGAKAALYARYGVAEYWVCDVEARRTSVHRQPVHGAYGERFETPFSVPLSPGALPQVSLRLSDAFTA